MKFTQIDDRDGLLEYNAQDSTEPLNALEMKICSFPS